MGIHFTRDILISTFEYYYRNRWETELWNRKNVHFVSFRRKKGTIYGIKIQYVSLTEVNALTEVIRNSS